MAPKVTSSSDRSKRKAKTTVTSDKGRKNRSSVSKAEVTRSGEGVKPGSAKVTQSRATGSPRALPPGKGPAGSLPPGKRGGELAKSGNSLPENPRRTSARNRQAQAASGSRGNGVRTQTVSPSGSYRAPSVPARSSAPTPKAAPKGGGLLRGLGKAVGVVGTAAAIADTARNIVDPNSQTSTNLRNAKNAVMRKMGGSGKDSPRGVATSWHGPNPPRRSKPSPSPSPAPSPKPSSGESRPAAPSSPSRSSGSTQRRSSSSSAPSPTPTASDNKIGRYAADKVNKGRNPLFEKTFGYKSGEGPKSKDGDKGPVSGVGPVKDGDKYASKMQRKADRSGGAGKAASAGAKSGPVAAKASAEKSIMDRIAEMKKKRQSS